MNLEEKINQLSSAEVQGFIRDHVKTNPATLALNWKGPSILAAREIIEQIEGHQKAADKFAELLVPGFLLPPRLNLEQTSSSETARYKASLVPQGSVIADLTGGFGIDSIYFSRVASSVIMCEPNPWLVELARHNFRILGIDNIRVENIRAEDFSIPDEVSFIYLDPSRRPGSGKKVFDPGDYEPDPFELQKSIKDLPFLLKTSPMADIQAVISQMMSVREVHIVSRNRQVRELLFLSAPGYNQEPEIVVSDPGLDMNIRFKKEDENRLPAEFREPEEGGYLYQPFPGLMKAGCFKELGKRTGTFRPAPDTNVYVSPDRVSFPGNTFLIEKIMQADLKAVKMELNHSRWVAVSKNFPISSEALSSKLKLAGSDDQFVWFVKTLAGNRAIISRKIN